MKNKISTPLITTLLMGLALGCMLGLAIVPAATAAETWKASFEEICGKVDASQTLGIKEMEELIQKADKLMPEIQKSDDPSKKIYLKRLKNCRSMYEFMIESKKDSGK